MHYTILGSSTLSKSYSNAQEQKQAQVMRTHGFRKFAITLMIKEKIDYEAREYPVGHKHSRGLDLNL